MKIADNVFVVTGAGNGMGRQVLLGLARRGARVAAVDLDEHGLTETERLARTARGTVSTHAVDVTDRAAIAALPSAVTAVHGQIDGVVNMAGIVHRFVPFTELADDEIDRIIDVNFWGTVTMSRAFLPILRQRPEATLTNMSSLAALVPFAGQMFYGASKGAVKQFSEGLYAELLDTNVRVVTIFPGNVSTNIAGNSGVQPVDAGGRKVRATTPEVAGERIVEGIAKDSFRVVIGADAHLLDTLARVSPKRTTAFIAKQMKSVL